MATNANKCFSLKSNLTSIKPICSSNFETTFNREKMSQASLMTKFQQAELSRLMFLGARTTDQITHSDWSNFVTHTAWTAEHAIFVPRVLPLLPKEKGMGMSLSLRIAFEMAARRVCRQCGEEFEKTLYYNHMPCLGKSGQFTNTF